MEVRIKENSGVAKVAAAAMKVDKVAIVFGSTIYLYNTGREEFLSDQDWVCHELMHIEQYRKKGFLGFLLQYLFDWMKNGYYNNKFEVEARENEKNNALLENIRFV